MSVPESPLAPSSIKANTGMWLGIMFCFAFTSAIWLARPYMPEVTFAEDQGALWYYWKLPDPTFLSHFTGWAGYLLHQIAIWSLIYIAQTKELRYSSYLHPINIIALLANAFFISLHLLQSVYFYDGLAASTPVWSSQISVIIMLVMILILENKRRGVFFGKSVPVLEQSRYALKKYHGYYFSWAIIFTFWFHPAEATIGHMWGFFYTTLLMVQSSLFFTRAHLNKYWTVTLEVLVLFHGTIVAIQTDTGWPMFFFGFVTIFIVTQMHGIGLRPWMKWAFGAAYGAGIYAVYGTDLISAIAEVSRIPVVEYLLAFVIALVFWIGIALAGLLSGTALRKPSTASA